MRDPVSLLTLGALGALSFVVVFTFSAVAKLDSSLAATLKAKDMQSATEEVTRPNGRKVTVTTVRKDGESVADWVARHDKAVAGWLQ